MAIAAQVLRERAQGEPEGDEQRDGRRRGQEQHGHEDQLGRHGQAGADLEPHPGGERVAGDEQRGGDPAVTAPVRRPEGDRGDGDGERRHHCDRGPRLAAIGCKPHARARFLDQGVVHRPDIGRCKRDFDYCTITNRGEAAGAFPPHPV